MKRKFEDKVAQLAFGDLSPEEAAKLEQEVHQNPEAQRALSLYKDMRDGLRDLCDVPEDQFSKERLRDAILTQGLRPVVTRPISNRTWLWMPAAGAAMGFALMLAINFAHHTNKSPSLLFGNPKTLALGADLKFPTSTVGPINTGVTRFAKATIPKPKNLDTMVAVKNPDEYDPRITANNNPEEGFQTTSYDPDLGNQPSTSGRSGVASKGVVAKNDAISTTASTSGPIVLIEQDKDDQTGACKATEVGSASNVLVGG